MCEYQIPFHVQEEIMKRLSVKSLIQFRSVSKAWKSLIDSPRFTAAHSLTQPQHLLVSYEDSQGDENYVCFIDDETFPQQRSVLNLPPLSAEQFVDTKIVGSSHGLVCLRDPSFEIEMTLVWNPSLRKYVVVAVPTNTIRSFVGFGVCPVTNDPKIISITQSSPEASYEVMVYTLSSGTWRSLSTNLPINKIRDPFHPVVTDGFIYWLAETLTRNCILSFDVTDESFQVIDVPDALARKDLKGFYICKLRESLALLQSHGHACTVVWMMEDGVQRSFAKLFTIAAPRDSIVGFRKSGLPIVEESDDDDDDDDDDDVVKLVLYEPNSENIDVLAISTPFACFSAHAYTETLLLLGRSDCISY